MKSRAASSKCCLLHGVDAIVERADAGQNHRAGVADFARRLRDAHIRADLEQRFVAKWLIAGAVVQ